MTNSESIEAWLRVHRLLIEREAAFTDLAIKAVQGETDMEELARQRAALIALREECSAAYSRAFPQACASGSDA